MERGRAFRDALQKAGFIGRMFDVAAHLHVSRSLLDLRFRELQGESVHDAIQSRRLDEVKRRLLSTRDSIEKISADCGWDNINSLKNLFRKATGKSMREWRASPV